MRKVTCTVIVACLTAGAGCHKEEKGVAPTAASSAPAPSASASPSASAPVLPKPPPLVELAIESGATTAVYDRTAFTVASGQRLHVVLKNNVVKSGGKPLAHNWVLFKPGAERRPGGGSSNDAPEKDIVAQTLPVPPGEFKDVTFTVTEPGKYQFRCTVPGHPATMTGVMTVEP